MLAPAVVVLTVQVGWFPVLAVVVGWLVVGLIRQQPRGAVPLDIDQIVGLPQEDVEPIVARASTHQLGELWEQSSRILRRAFLPATVSAHVQLRELLLAEMERRDAEAVDRWLADRPDRLDPRQYLEPR